MIIKIKFDGACHNIVDNNNHMGIGLAVFINDVYSEDHSDAIHAEGLNGERGTSNIAEWRGCVEAMRKACKLKLKHPGAIFEIYSDSQLISNQFNGDWLIMQNHFKIYKDQADKLARIAGIKRISWIRREFNKEADKLSKQGLKVEI